jgi:trehalose synthase
VQKSLAEGFGLTVSEAMFKRRPVIGSAVGGIADQIVDGDTGILLPDPADEGALGVAVAGLLADRPRLTAMGDRARARVVDRFLPDTELTRWSAVISSLLS